jgi:hypothetical protein
METPESLWRRLSRMPPSRREPLLIALALLALGGFYLLARFTSDAPVTYEAPADHFKYGSTGGERASGIPYVIWKVLPRLFPDLLPKGSYRPGQEYAAFGFLYEGDKDLPIGVSRRNVQGLPRVFLNCAICHVGSVRFRVGDPRQLVPGMPSNTVDLQGFLRFLLGSAADERFEPDRLLYAIEAMPREAPAGVVDADRLDPLNRAALRQFGVLLMRQRLLMIRHRLRYMDMEPDFGPGRVDTFSPAKALENWRFEDLPPDEFGGTVDLPSVWLQRPRRGMQLHWDGNNTKMEERDRNASFGTGTFPPTLDRTSLKRIEDFLFDAEPPRFPADRIDKALADSGKPVYEEYCARCHGRDGRDFTGSLVGKVTPLEKIGTDRRRLDQYTFDLSAIQNSIYAGYGDERYSHFRKTFGYVNMPLDGIWLRAPYLHNGSVPTLRDLLEPARSRPKVFYRGYDLYDPERMGFVSSPDKFDEKGHSRLEPDDPRTYFRQAVPCAEHPDQCQPRATTYRARCEDPEGSKPAQETICGNGNWGHEGREYGTDLRDDQKKALIEYLKTF